MGLSPLLEHKSNHKFLDTPSNKCITCDRTENLELFFLYCTRSVAPRHLLFTSIKSLKTNFELLNPCDKTKFLLYGDSTLDLATNKLLLKATLKFVAIRNSFHEFFFFSALTIFDLSRTPPPPPLTVAQEYFFENSPCSLVRCYF